MDNPLGVLFLALITLVLMIILSFWYISIPLIILLAWGWDTIKARGFRGKIWIIPITITSYQEDYDHDTRPLTENEKALWELTRGPDDPPAEQIRRFR